MIDHPEFETIEEDEETSIHMNRIVPVTRLGTEFHPGYLRTLVHRALTETDLEGIPSSLGSSKAERAQVHSLSAEFAEIETARRVSRPRGTPRHPDPDPRPPGRLEPARRLNGKTGRQPAAATAGFSACNT